MSSYGDSSENPVIDNATIIMPVDSASQEQKDTSATGLSPGDILPGVYESRKDYPPKSFRASRFVVALITAIVLFSVFNTRKRA